MGLCPFVPQGFVVVFVVGLLLLRCNCLTWLSFWFVASRSNGFGGCFTQWACVRSCPRVLLSCLLSACYCCVVVVSRDCCCFVVVVFCIRIITFLFVVCPVSL